MQYAQRIAALTAEQRALLELKLRKQNPFPAQAQMIPRRQQEPGKDVLSLDQERLWFIHQLDPASPAYNLNSAYSLNGPLDPTSLVKALNKIVERHEILRTVFVNAGGKPVQIIAPSLTLDVQQIDLRAFSPTERYAQAERLFSEHALVPFDLTTLPLVRALLLRLDEEEHRLLLTMHHVITDWWSLSLINKELVLFYRACTTGISPPLPALSIQYADFAAWQQQWVQGPEAERLFSYWNDQLTGAPQVLEIPGDRPRLPAQSSKGASVPLKLSRPLYQSLKSLSRAEDVTLFMTTLAVFQLLIYQYTGQSDFLIGSPSANRNKGGTENLVGYFLNSLVLRAQLSGDLTCRELLKQVRKTVLAAYAHQDMPFGELVSRLQPQRDLSRMPLAQVSFVYLVMGEHSGFGKLNEKETTGLHINPLMFDVGISKYDISCGLWETDTELKGHLEYNTDLLDEATAQRMAGQLGALLEALVSNPDARISDLSQVSEKERQQLLVEWNSTGREYPNHRCVHELFEMQAERTPDAVAVVFDDEQVSYSELNIRANRLAHYLRQSGAGPEMLIAILVQPSIEMVVCVLAILKAGAAYVPLDATYPSQRLAFMLADAQPALLLTDSALAQQSPPTSAKVLCLDVLQGSIALHSAANLPSTSIPAQLAYLIYTSGSTGRPKGVLVTHQSFVNLLQVMREQPGLTASDTLLSVTTLAFDMAGVEIFLPLLEGARLVLVSREVATDGQLLAQTLARTQATIMQATLATWRLLLAAGWHPTRQLRMLCGAEALSPEMAARLTSDGGELWNMYGPTEITVWASTARVNCGDGVISLGRPIANTEFYVLDQQLQLVPVGAVAELYIGGAGLTRGYLHQAALTAERFVPNPFSRAGGERLYRTGDLVRRRADGELEYKGRADDQVKVRSFRIELGEVEAALIEHAGIRECVVVAREDGSGEKRLVAYAVAEAGQNVNAGDVRSHMLERVPEYMAPSALVMLEKMPLTPSGKVDRRALPAPEQLLSEIEGDYVEPRTPMEELLAGIWAETLGVAQVGVNDNFFNLGGHSLLVTRLVSRIREAFKVELPLGSIFETPTLAPMARLIESAMQATQGMEAAPMPRASREGHLPLSFAQQRLWFIDQLEPDNPFYNIPTAFRLTGPLNVAALEETLNEIVRRHEVLRTSFAMVDGQPVQVISDPEPLAFPIEELMHLAEEEREAEAQRLAGEEAQRIFDLSSGPLVRARLLRLSQTEHVVLFTMHHIVSDGWSTGVLISEVAALYQAFSAGQASPLPELGIQYADFSVWQRGWLTGEVLERQLSYWKQQLGGTLPVLELPSDYQRPSVYSHRGGQFRFTLTKEVSEGLKELSKQERVTLFMTLLAAFQALLSRYSGQEDVVVGTDIANRNRGETEQLIGFFVNQLVMRTDLSGNPSFAELLRRVREVALGAYVHQDVPFEKLVEELAPERDLSRNPFFQVKFILQNAPSRALELPGLRLSAMSGESYTTRFDLTFSMMDGENGLFGAVEYSAELFAETTIARMVEHFKLLLSAIVADRQQRLMALPLMSAAEQQQVLVEWNDTETGYAAESCIQDLFEEQVARNPEALAVVFGNEQLSYAELNARANQLAHHLRQLGVGAEVLVGISTERSLEMLVGVLGILKAGGAYVPLDPAYPLERLAFMIEDAQVPVLLTQERWLDNLPADSRQVVCLDTDWKTIATASEQNPMSVTTPDNLAYVIYTSGSTGRPKGVQLAHRGLLNLAQAQQRTFSLSAEQRVLQFASLSFDASIFEIVMSCATGATLYLASSDDMVPGSSLTELLREQAISNVTLPPSALAQMSEEDLPALQTIVVAGEACGAELVERWATGRRFFNAYGPSEATVWSSVAECVAGSGRRPHIGRPIDNVQLYVLDQLLQPVPVGVAGELYIGGAGLARCYLGRPELTAERFLPQPFSLEPGRRLYRTGDVARYLSDGNLEFLGRVDQQVKIRGFRIELGEVEAVLNGHPSVREAVVVAREEQPGDQRLVAYIVTTGESALTTSELRAYFKETLPEFMVPSAFVMMDALPVSPSGKIDRRALPAPGEARPELANAYLAARTPVEEVLAAIYAEVLQLEQVGINDSFFELGGHSLLATQFISRVREAFQVELALRSIFETPSVSELAQVIETTLQAEKGLQSPPITAVSREGDLPVSFAQQRLWFIDQLEPGSPAYNLPAAVRLRGSLNFAALELTVNEIVRRHEILRTTFATNRGQPIQVITPFQRFALPLSDLSGLPEEEREAEAMRLGTDETKTAFDLSTGPLLRAHLLRLGEQEHVMLFTMHHSISDGWSMGVLVREVAALYTAFSEGDAAPLPELPVQYADFAAWQRSWLVGETLEAHLAYWKQQLRGIPAVLELPATRPPAAAPSFRGSRQSFVFPVSLSQQLKALSQREKCTLFMTLLAAFATQLHRYSGQSDIVLGTDVANRNRAETEGLIGFFVNQLVLRADLSGNPTFSELLVRVREMTLGAYAHQDLPFDKLVEVLRPDRTISRTPLFQAKLVLLNAPLQHLELPGLTLTPLDVRDESGTAKFDLAVTLMDTAEGLIGYMEYNTDLFTDTDIARLIEHYQTLLCQIVSHPEARLSALEILSDAERQDRELEKLKRAESNINKLKFIKPKPVSLLPV